MPIRDTASGDLPSRDAAVGKTMLPWARIMPLMARSVVVLPAPLARHDGHVPLLDTEVDVVQHLDLAVAALHVLQRQEAHAGAPRYASMTIGSLRTASRWASAILRPKSRTTMWSRSPSPWPCGAPPAGSLRSNWSDRPDGLAQLVDLAVGEAVGGLVHHQQLGVGGQRPGELDALERAERQARHRPVGEADQVEPVEQLEAPAAEALSSQAAPRRTMERPNPTCRGRGRR